MDLLLILPSLIHQHLYLPVAISKLLIQLLLTLINPMQIKRGIEKAVEAVVEELKKMSTPIKEQKEIAQEQFSTQFSIEAKEAAGLFGSAAQEEFIEAIQSRFGSPQEQQGTWGK